MLVVSRQDASNKHLYFSSGPAMRSFSAEGIPEHLLVAAKIQWKRNGKIVPLKFYQFCKMMNLKKQLQECCHLAYALYLVATKPPCCYSLTWELNKIFKEAQDIEPKDAADRPLSHGAADR